MKRFGDGRVSPDTQEEVCVAIAVLDEVHIRLFRNLYDESVPASTVREVLAQVTIEIRQCLPPSFGQQTYAEEA